MRRESLRVENVDDTVVAKTTVREKIFSQIIKL